MPKVDAKDFDKTLDALETEERGGIPGEQTPPEITPPEKKPEETTIPPETTPPDDKKPEEGTVVTEKKPGEQTPPPEYVVNKKYKVHEEEFEFDPVFDSLLTNKENEDKIRTLHAKAHGIDAVIKSRDSWKTKYDESKKEIDSITPAKTLYQRASEYSNSGDNDNAVKCLAASMTSIFTEAEIIAAATLIAESQLKPEQQAQLTRDIKFHKDAIDLEFEKSKIASNQAKIDEETVQRDITFFFAQPDVKKINDAYDNIHGKGAFLKRVHQYGHQMSLQTGKLYPVANVIQDMVKEYKPFVSLTSEPPAKPGDVKKTVVTPDKNTKIPNPKASASVGKGGALKSLSDLDKKIEEMEASE